MWEASWSQRHEVPDSWHVAGRTCLVYDLTERGSLGDSLVSSEERLLARLQGTARLTQ